MEYIVIAEGRKNNQIYQESFTFHCSSKKGAIKQAKQLMSYYYKIHQCAIKIIHIHEILH